MISYVDSGAVDRLNLFNMNPTHPHRQQNPMIENKITNTFCAVVEVSHQLGLPGKSSAFAYASEGIALSESIPNKPHSPAPGLSMAILKYPSSPKSMPQEFLSFQNGVLAVLS